MWVRPTTMANRCPTVTQPLQTGLNQLSFCALLARQESCERGYLQLRTPWGHLINSGQVAVRHSAFTTCRKTTQVSSGVLPSGVQIFNSQQNTTSNVTCWGCGDVQRLAGTPHVDLLSWTWHYGHRNQYSSVHYLLSPCRFYCTSKGCPPRYSIPNVLGARFYEMELRWIETFVFHQRCFEQGHTKGQHQQLVFRHLVNKYPSCRWLNLATS